MYFCSDMADRQEISLNDYVSRINSVIIYVEKNIDKLLNLDAIACHANFSPFHFHRIFSALEGETPAGFILRLRTEKVARLLQENITTSITEIAYSCGFSNYTSFNRAFKKHFGMTAQEFRKFDKTVFAKDKQFYNAKGEVLKRTESTIEYEGTEISTFESDTIIQNADIRIKRMPEYQVAYIRYVGDFYQIGETYDKLLNWAAQNEQLNVPEAKLFTVYHDDPSVTKMDKHRQSVCITIPNNFKVGGCVSKMIIAEGKYLVGDFELLDIEFEKAWNTMYFTLIERGHKFRNANIYEMYETVNNTPFSQPYKVHLCIPIE
ncbi:MAG TPA: AraC family transcriptional regulator [Porphyromonadaceae bacterium]|jgi:AraC family transcriptional regulator|nr:AraC family transcriptional regulator [Porphyromonadaceae bacterium]